MKTIIAGRDWASITSRTARYLIERAVLYVKNTFTFPMAPVLASTAPSLAVKTEPVADAAVKNNSTDEFYRSHFFVLYGIQPSWDTERIRLGLRDLKLSFGPFSKLIVCSESYVDELVQHCEEFNYDAYLLTCDGRDELKNAVRILQTGKLYLSKSVITSYCITRRKEWAY
jgi:hypothetical protein